MIDQFYTPPALATFLAGAARVRRPGIIADFAMGDGALLRAAEARWPRAKLFGSDINPAAGEAAAGLDCRPNFSVFDFLSDGAEPDEMRPLVGRCDIILLNPPFTCKGNKRFSVDVKGVSLAGSKALVFVARALRYLKPGGEILAIVPASCATSERDNALLETLRKTFTVEQVGEINRNGFDGCSVAVIMLRLRHRGRLAPRKRPAAPHKFVALKSFKVLIMRGTTSIHRTSGAIEGLPVLHTVDLRDKVEKPQRWTVGSRRLVSGRTVLLPRVGRPDVSKLVQMNLSNVVLSDCVIGIQTVPRGHEDEVLRALRSSWSALEALYGGSCAPYITVGQLQTHLLSLGVHSEIVTDMSSQDELGSISREVA
ncbi:N-6 DNA methylase [Caulobacter sp.]|uniref:N-6 DNA methylase n=1 Tax=Caulobacter sp. TaxID=78 RepID=UPI001B2F17B9|nr:N-6 DNA methylase [Caulobacter sp.]MBO9546960.1 N-6 DNA methylase [Caulobacter sp.]